MCVPFSSRDGRARPIRGAAMVRRGSTGVCRSHRLLTPLAQDAHEQPEWGPPGRRPRGLSGRARDALWPQGDGQLAKVAIANRPRRRGPYGSEDTLGAAIAVTIDTTVPAAPLISATTPTAPADDDAPFVRGGAEATTARPERTDEPARRLSGRLGRAARWQTSGGPRSVRIPWHVRPPS